MAKKCIYCNSEMSESSVMDVCQPCGYQVWGEKMFSAIIENMENARESGDLYQGSVTDSVSEIKENSDISVKTQEVQTPQDSPVIAHSSSSLFEEASQNQQSIPQQQDSSPQESQGAQDLINDPSENLDLSVKTQENISSDSKIISL